MSASTFGVKDAIQRVIEGRELTLDEASATLDQIMTGLATGAQIGALVAALRMKGETVQEIAGFAQAMRKHALKVEVGRPERPIVDTCGTGGDSAGTFNISTTASFVIAGAGVRVAKHGNRAMSSKCGSADLLEGLGVRIELTPAQVVTCIDEANIGFMFAPAFHPAMRFVGPARREIGVRTVFNLLGPLTNPAGVRHQLIGVGHPGISDKLAEVLGVLGSEHAVLVHAEEGLDELGLAGASAITEWNARAGGLQRSTITPEDVGLQRASLADLLGGDVTVNTAITRRILAGERGPKRDATLFNAGAGLYAADVAGSIAEGVALAAQVIDDGRAQAALERLIAVTQAFPSEAA